MPESLPSRVRYSIEAISLTELTGGDSPSGHLDIRHVVSSYGTTPILIEPRTIIRRPGSRDSHIPTSIASASETHHSTVPRLPVLTPSLHLHQTRRQPVRNPSPQ